MSELRPQLVKDTIHPSLKIVRTVPACLQIHLRKNTLQPKAVPDTGAAGQATILSSCRHVERYRNRVCVSQQNYDASYATATQHSMLDENVAYVAVLCMQCY